MKLTSAAIGKRLARGRTAWALALLAAGALCAAAQAADSGIGETGGVTMTQQRKQAAQRQRRIIMNNDGNDCRGEPKDGAGKTTETFLAKRTTPLIGSQVDAIFYCTGVFNLYTHHSAETELLKQPTEKDADWAWELAKFGTDSLQTMVEFGRGHGMEVFWSMRMNDTHDSGADLRTLFAKWKEDHPQCLMGQPGQKFPHGGGRWSAVDYAEAEVREKVFRILRDVATRYDVDGLELDFYRHPVYFRPQMTGEPVTQAHCDLMTDLLRRVRAMTEDAAARRGRSMLIAIRIPDSIGFSKAIGLDVARWLEEDLVDIVTGGCYFQFEPWENLVALGRRYGVPVYAGLSGSRIVAPSSKPEDPKPKTGPLWNAQAKLAWDAGVDGIYTFNLFAPKSEIFRQIGSPETLSQLESEPRPITGDKKTMERWLKGGSAFLKIPQ